MRALIALFLGGFLLDQQPQAIRVNSQLVEINVVALNRAGQPVVDLTKDDFEILDNGKPQTGSEAIRRSEDASGAKAVKLEALCLDSAGT